MDKSPETVREMFDSIDSRYDCVNTLLSFDSDRRWRREMVRAAAVAAGGLVADFCTGTGSVARAIRRRGVRTAGIDFSGNMLRRARMNGGLFVAAGDALEAPLKTGAFDAATVAFGIRNVSDMPAALGEMVRVVKPGGRVVVTEFSRPDNRLVGSVYGFYLRRMLPVLGGAVSGNRPAYEYLAESIEGFPEVREVARLLCGAGCAEIRTRRFMFGVVTLYLGVKGGG